MSHNISRRNVLGASLGLAALPSLKHARAESSPLASLTLKQASDQLRAKAVSSVELTKACLARIEKLNPSINAFITVTADQALEAARQADALRKFRGGGGPLLGIPVAVKDNMDTAGIRTTGASELFKDRIPAEDAEVVHRLKAAGAVILGKLNLHELAYGGTSSVTFFGPVHNPWALDHIPGGSSGGSAAAIAADLCYGTLGTDTAGSVRIPASLCGVVGFKPTYGRVSIRGVIPLSTSLDHVGPLSKTVEDAAFLLNAIAGYDEADPTTADVPVPDYPRLMLAKPSKLRLGVPRAPFFNNIDPEITSAMDAALDVLRKLTASMTDVKLPTPVNPAQVWDAEIYAYHAKWIKETPQLYQPQTRAAILRSGQETAETYANARWNMQLQRREIRQAFSDIDLIITPTEPGVAGLIIPGAGAGGRGSGRGGGSAANTSPFDVWGLPTISIPCGFSPSGLPIGLQITGAPFAEGTVLSLAHAYEQSTAWHTRRPNLPAA